MKSTIIRTLKRNGWEVTAVFPSGRVRLVKDGVVCKCESLEKALEIVTKGNK